MLSPAFDLKKIIISGNNNLSESQIYDLIGFDNNKSNMGNIFLFNILRAKKNLLASSFVSKVKIKYLLPDRIFINIIEYEPKCYIKYLKNAYVLIDRNALVLEISKSCKKRVPVFVGLDFDSFALGKKLNIDSQKTLDNILWLSSVIIKNNLDPNNLFIDFSNIGDIHLYIKNMDILFGEIDDAEYKIALLKAILDTKSEYLEKAGTLSLKEKNQPVVFKFIT